MNTTLASTSTKFRVGFFTLLGLILLGALTVFVNDKPFWWRSCNLVHINVDDATGLKTKSPVRSLGLQIGYLRSVELTETYVRLGICITAPVQVLPDTRAYIRGEGFLGDKFVELKPVKYSGGARSVQSFWISEAYAADSPAAAAQPSPSPIGTPRKDATKGEIPVGNKSQDVQHLVEQVDGLVTEMTALTNNLKEAINPKELRATMQQLNKTLENASKTLAPEGNLNTTAQRTLAKLEDAIEQLRDQMTRINKGEGSLGMLLNDPSYAEEIREALKNLNRLLSKVGGVRFVVTVGGEQINAYDGGRGFFRLQIYPTRDRYYLLGITSDPRGKRTVINTTVNSGGVTTTTQTTQVEESGLLLSGMLGKIFFRRLDLAAGFLHGDGTISIGARLGPDDREEMAVVRDDLYSRGKGIGIENRLTLTVRPFLGNKYFSSVYVDGGLETFKKVSGHRAWMYGAGVTFDDEDIKLLFALR